MYLYYINNGYFLSFFFNKHTIVCKMITNLQRNCYSMQQDSLKYKHREMVELGFAPRINLGHRSMSQSKVKKKN